MSRMDGLYHCTLTRTRSLNVMDRDDTLVLCTQVSRVISSVPQDWWDSCVLRNVRFAF